VFELPHILLLLPEGAGMLGSTLGDAELSTAEELTAIKPLVEEATRHIRKNAVVKLGSCWMRGNCLFVTMEGEKTIKSVPMINST
jgi:hypothetical protein